MAGGGTVMAHNDADTFIPADVDQRSINTIRFLSVDAVQQANSGHPGLPLDAAPMGYVLWTRFLKHNLHNPHWFNRDRFILSAGHCSMLLYSLLYLTGYPLSLDQIKHFRQWRSKTPGHPERDPDTGVAVTTGPLGQGFGNGVGEAMAEAHLAARYNRPGYPVVDHYTYALVSDGDLMEGVSSEAASLAGHLKLGKLIYLYDNNHISLSGSTDLTFTEDCAHRFTAYGWHTQCLEDGNDLVALDAALRNAQLETTRPSLILVRTHIGYGSPHKHDTFAAHGSPLGEEEVRLTKLNLGWPLEPTFYVPDDVMAHMRQAVAHGEKAEMTWEDTLAAYVNAYPDLAKEFDQARHGVLPDGWDADIPTFPADTKGMATRVAGGKVMQAIAPHLPQLIGGSADLDPSTHTALEEMGEFKAPNTLIGDMQGAASGGWGYTGRNIAFGVREHGMGAILNGMAAHGGTLPFGATFLIFSDYMRPPMRLAALSNLHVIYVFTHDSIALGEDGPTHQPVEQLANLRAIPRFLVIRPADANETAVAWRMAIETRERPVALVLTRQHVPILDRTTYAAADGLRQGAYILSETPGGQPDLLLIASGSEVSLVLAAQEQLQTQGVRARVISMPSWELFDAQPQEYRETLLPTTVRARLAVEAGSPQGWSRYVGDHGDVLGVVDFGASEHGEVVMREYGFTVENVCRRALALLK